MRIIAGEAKNRIIKTRKGFDTRPTLESVKESLFSIIAPYIEGSVFLDLFSGSGSISLEAISRGAKRAVMIEKDGEALKYIIENIDNLGFSDRCRAYKNDVIRAIEILGRKNEKFDIIFMDPPYQDNVTKKVLKVIDKANILAITNNEKTANQLVLSRGVISYVDASPKTLEEFFILAEVIAKKLNLVENNDIIIATCGESVFIQGTTNSIKVIQVKA